jgi:hypothetical protein
VKLTRTVEENLVVVYTDPSGAEHERDATPDDLERAGWVRAEETRADGSAAQPSPGTLAHLRADLRDMTARAEKRCRELVAERNEARAEVERLTAPEGGKVMSSGLAEAVELELMRIVDDAIGGLADFGASLVCRGHASGAAHTVAESAYRLGVAHKRARHAQPETKGRATDEELVAIGREAYDEGILEGVPHVPWLARIVRAVAARVRQEGIRWAGGVDFAKQEPGLLERLVAKGCDIKVEENPDGSWAVRLRTVTETLTTNAPAADVPAALARLAGLEVEQ